MFDTLFKGKDARMEAKAEKEAFGIDKAKVIVTTTDSLPQAFEIIGVVSSNLHDAQIGFDTFLDDLKGAALNLDGDAVIGLTFQTVGFPTEYTSLRNANRYDNHYHMYSEVKSRAVGTVVKFITEDNKE